MQSTVLPQSKQYGSDKKNATNFHSQLSDEWRQNAETTHAHMLVLDQCLMLKKYLLKNAPSLITHMSAPNNIDVPLTSICSYFFCQKAFWIDQAIVAPRHVNDSVDGLNACDEQHMNA